MEIIRCKAKEINNHNWVFGYPFRKADKAFYIYLEEDDKEIPIIPETLCYSTGESDKNGKELYIGDTINDFSGGVFKPDTKHRAYHPRQAFPPMKEVSGDRTCLGTIIWEDGTTRVQNQRLSYPYNISKASKLSDMEYYCNIWDSIYPVK